MRSSRAPLRHDRLIRFRDDRQQSTGKEIGLEGICACRLDQLAKLLDLALLEQLRPIVERLQLGVEIPYLPHCRISIYRVDAP
ncbi:hypothetical protein MGWOODY_Smn2962 [hydrothermal vent metagenome]|uniref:Uncharacterized protein n=1 Tax=hydrothermal vent metagenome TaxID=652676 RepID=A0A160TJI2_9ZZZZ